ncbi:MAG: F0F1 ATP synthase subunit A [Dehalococcoidia bacterium]|nr:F0F1 ATP synthase subunit A [Dehalococcoidia bacterium]
MAAIKRPAVLLIFVLLLSLVVYGLMNGAIGTSLTSGEGEGTPLLEAPHPHIPPQKIGFPSGKGGESVTSADGFVITNTILSSWVVMIILIGLFYMGTRNMKMVPSGLQNFLEFILESLYNFVQGVAGEENSRKFFPIIATIFLFVMLNAWVGLLPIYPALGFMDHGHMKGHLLRPAGTDLNMPLALALISFVFVEFWGLKLLKLNYLAKFVRLENLRKGNFAQVPIDLFVGVLELLSEFVRIVSFTFRLFGNMTAGEILLLVITYLVPFVLVLPFYGLELLVGLVQALIFAGLTLVFVVVAVTPHSEEEH